MSFAVMFIITSEVAEWTPEKGRGPLGTLRPARWNLEKLHRPRSTSHTSEVLFCLMRNSCFYKFKYVIVNCKTVAKLTHSKYGI